LSAIADCFKQSAVTRRSEREAGRSADGYWSIDNASAFVAQLGCLTGDALSSRLYDSWMIMAAVHRPIRFIR
jgi:hypothetical protein